MPRPDARCASTPPNRLLAALPSPEYQRLVPFLEPVSLSYKQVLHEPGERSAHVYFPAGAVVSMICPEAGKEFGIEAGVIGREGMAGLSVFLEAETGPLRSIVQVPGEALEMSAQDFRQRVARDTALHGLLLRYAHTFMTQLCQSVYCNSMHPIEKRMCRWLLAVHDRAETDRFPITHEFLAAMLGVRRASVTEAARGLRAAGMIRYSGGELTVLDRRGLDALACGCHRAVQEFHRPLVLSESAAAAAPGSSIRVDTSLFRR